MNLKFHRILEVEVYMCVQNFIKLSAAVHELLTVHSISDNCRLRSQISLGRIKQSQTALSITIFPTFDENNSVNFDPLTKK